MGTPVWYLIASLLILVNGETNDNSQSPSERSAYSTPAPGRRLTGMKELVLYLTADQAKVLEEAGAIVRPFPQFEDVFLQQKLQQSVEEHTETQNQPPTTDGDIKQDVEKLDEFYKVINVQQLNEDLTVADQIEGKTTEKPRPKYKYVPRGRQQEYAATYVQKKNNKTKSYSTEYVRYLPNFEVENVKIEPYRAQPIPGYYYQDIIANSEPPTFLNADVLDVQKPEQLLVNKEIQQIQEIQSTFGIQTQEENQKPVELQHFEDVQQQQEIYEARDVQRPLNIPSLEYVQKSQQPNQAVVIQTIGEVKHQEDTYKPQDILISHNIQKLEYRQKPKRPVEIQKLEEVEPQENIYKTLEVQRIPNIQRLEFIKKPNRPVEIQKLEEVQPQQPISKPLDIQRQRNIQRLKYIQKSKRPLEIQKLEEVYRNENVRHSVELQRPYRPQEIQKLEEVQRNENFQHSVELQRPYRPQEVQKLEEVQRNENVQHSVELQRPYRPQELQKHEEVQRFEEIQRPLEIQTTYRPLEFQGHEEIQRPENIQPFIEISTRTPVIDQERVQQPIESIEQIQPSLNDKGPIIFERKAQILQITRGSAIVGQPEDIQTPLEFQTSLKDQQAETPKISPTPTVSAATATINEQFSSLLAPLVQHEKITESIAQQTELENGERIIQNKLHQLKESGSVDESKFKAEFDKLNKNLGKQNALAEKIALEEISKKNEKPQIVSKENLDLKRPVQERESRVEVPVPKPGLQRVPPHLEFKIPRQYPVPFGIVRPIPVPVLQPENADLEKPLSAEREKLISAPEFRNVFADFPYLVQGNDELPTNYPIHQSDQLAVLRDIWEH